ncbi:hypothetical protein L208DRAFT_1426818 [Tricholoma matsutake]|nr:hypothetical protein L208DRAFT_1426818 [Tricholoma matsutake 945]
MGPIDPTLQQLLPSSQTCHPLQRKGAFHIEPLTAEEQALEDAMNQCEDVPNDGGDSESEGDNDDHNASTLQPRSSQPSVSNVVASTQWYAMKKKLCPEQCNELDIFLLVNVHLNISQDTALEWQAKLFACININNYGVAVMLSVNISTYKGDILCNHVPIKDSIVNNTDIFTLAQVIVHGMPCHTMVQLCTHIALKVVVYIECSSSEKYWNWINMCLEFICSKAGSSTSKTSKAFNEILKIDHAKLGVGEEYVIGDAIADEWQQHVDDVVLGTADAV